MRFITLSSIIAMVSVVCFAPHKAVAVEYVQISEPFINVYEYLDPKSTVVKMAKKGDRFELIYAGDGWYQVKVRDKTGWVERKAGFIIEQSSAMSLIVSIVLVILFLIGTIYGVWLYISKQKTA